MGLKFERTDNLDKLFESFAVDPENSCTKRRDRSISKTTATK